MVEVDDCLAIDMLVGISKGDRILIPNEKRPLVKNDEVKEDDDEYVMELDDNVEFIDDEVSAEMITKKPKTTPCFDELKKWLKCNLRDPYPTTNQINWFIETSDLTERQILNWFGNARRRWPELKGKGKRNHPGRRRK